MTILAGIAAVGLLHLLAWGSARTTIYTLTNRRIVMRIGMAVPKCINLPLTEIALGRSGRARRRVGRLAADPGRIAQARLPRSVAACPRVAHRQAAADAARRCPMRQDVAAADRAHLPRRQSGRGRSPIRRRPRDSAPQFGEAVAA